MRLPGGLCGAWRGKEWLRPRPRSRYRGYRVDTVLHYSVPWHSDEAPALSRKELLRAAYGRIRALLDRLTHHVSILEMNGQSYRLSQSRARFAAIKS